MQKQTLKSQQLPIPRIGHAAAGEKKTISIFQFDCQQGKILFFGVILPVVAVMFESSFHFCAKHFFDPFPSTNHIILFLLIPLSNYLTLVASKRNLSAHYALLSLTSGMAMGIGAIYSLMCLPLTASSVFFVGAFGFGLLGLAPVLSLPCSWLAGKKICNLAAQHKTYFNPHQVEHIGHLIILVMVLAVELPSTLTRVYLGMAATPETAQIGIDWLRKYGSEEVMLRACYERSGRATDILGSVYEAGHPLSVNSARLLFYKVTGKPFNSVPIPASARATIQHALAYDPGGLNAKVEDEFDLDTDIAGDVISGNARGLSLASSEFQGNIDGDALVGELNWSFSFANVSKYDREARAKILLPTGAVVSQATLTVDGREHDAKIMTRQAARTYYRQAVMEHKDDPLLVSTCGPDQILVQCFPVHPDSKMKVSLKIECPLALDATSDAALSLPAFAEKNFQDNSTWKIGLLSTTPLSVSGKGFSLQSKQASNEGKKTYYEIGAKLNSIQAGEPTTIAHIARHHECHSVSFSDAPEGHFEKMIGMQCLRTPEKLTVVIDGSVSLKEQLPLVLDGLKAIPKSISVTIVLVGDLETILCVNAKSDSTEFQNAISALEKVQLKGGQDNTLTVLKFLTKAAAGDGGDLLWIHGPQPVSDVPSNLKDLLLIRSMDKLHNSISPHPLLYEFPVAVGPVELLTGIDYSQALWRLQKVGSFSDDLKQLYRTWSSVPQLESIAADIAPQAIQSPNLVAGGFRDKCLAQLFAFERIIRDLESSPNPDISEPIGLSDLHHLITPVSSAVVTDEDTSLTPLPRDNNNKDALRKLFSSQTLDGVHRNVSYGMTNVVNGVGTILIMPLAISGCSGGSMQGESFDTRQLNRLNSVSNAPAEKNARQSAPAAPPPSVSISREGVLSQTDQLSSTDEAQVDLRTKDLQQSGSRVAYLALPPSSAVPNDLWIWFSDIGIAIIVWVKLRKKPRKLHPNTK